MIGVVAALLLVGPGPAPVRPLIAGVSSGTIVGRIVDHATHRPICDAIVAVNGVGKFTMSSRDGIFTINVPVGLHALTVRALGYWVAEVRGVAVHRGATRYVPFVGLKAYSGQCHPRGVDVIQTDDSVYVAQVLQMDMIPRLPPDTGDLLPFPSRGCRCPTGLTIMVEEPHARKVIRGTPVSWEDVRERRAAIGRIKRAAVASNTPG